MRRIYGYSLFAGQVVLAIVMMLVFFSWAPWINCRPIDQLSPDTLGAVQIPETAKCFNINHGQIIFSDRLPVNEDPFPFFLLTLALIGCFLSLLILNHLHRKERKQSQGFIV